MAPARAIAGESVTFSGRLPTHFKRPVSLQTKSGTTWIAVASASAKATGSFAISYRAPDQTATYRVVARRVRSGGKAYPVLRTGTKKLAIDAQAATSTHPDTAQANEEFAVCWAVTPVRSGRPVEFEVDEGDGWDIYSEVNLSPQGKTCTRYTGRLPGTLGFRIHVLTDEGAEDFYSSREDVEILAPPPERLIRVSQRSDQTSYNDEAYEVAMTPSGDRVLWELYNGGPFIWDRTSQVSTPLAAPAAIGGTWKAGMEIIAASSDLDRILIRHQVFSGTTMWVWERSTGDVVGRTFSGDPATFGAEPISGDGRYVVFETKADIAGDPNRGNFGDVFLWDTESDAVSPVSPHMPDGRLPFSRWPSISANGRYVVYEEDHQPETPFDPSLPGVTRWDRTTGVRQEITAPGADFVDNFGCGQLSADGRSVLVRVFDGNNYRSTVWEAGGTVDYLEVAGSWPSARALSPDGSKVLVEGTEFFRDGNFSIPLVYLDRVTGDSEVVSIDSHGVIQEGGGGILSEDGRYAVFGSFATTFVDDPDQDLDTDVFLWDRDYAGGSARNGSGR